MGGGGGRYHDPQVPGLEFSFHLTGHIRFLSFYNFLNSSFYVFHIDFWR